MADITMCEGIDLNGNVCNVRGSCYRYLAQADKYQSWFVKVDKIGERCPEYWEVVKEKVD